MEEATGPEALALQRMIAEETAAVLADPEWAAQIAEDAVVLDAEGEWDS